MRKHIKAILFAIPMSFLIGAWWGLSNEGSREILFKTPTLKVLASRDYFSSNTLTQLEDQLKVKINLKEYAFGEPLSAEDLKSFDILQLYSYHLKQIKNLELADLAMESVDNIVSPNFKFTWVRNLHPYSWGYSGFVLDDKIPLDITLEKLLSAKKYKGKVIINQEPHSLVSTVEFLNPETDYSAQSIDESVLKKQLNKILDNLYTGSKAPDMAFKDAEVAAVEIQSFEQEHFDESRLALLKSPTELWISYLGVSPRSDIDLAKAFISKLFNTNNYASNLMASRHNSVLRANVDELMPNKQSSFLKLLPLEKISVMRSLDAVDTLWSKVLSSQSSKTK